MYVLLFLSLDLSSICCVLVIWWAGTHVFALLWLHSCLVSSDRVSLWTYGSPKGTQRDGPGFVCVVYPSPRGVGVGRCRTCPHRRDVWLRCTPRCQWCCAFMGTMALRGRGWQSRSSGHNGYPQPVGEGVGKRGYDSVASLRVFVSLRWWALGVGGCVQHGDTPQ